MADDSADLVIAGNSRRVAMDITKLEPKTGVEDSIPSGKRTEIEGEVHDQEDLNGKDAILKIDGAGEFKIHFHTPTRFRGEFVAPWSDEPFREKSRS
jgi:hypothetical protein